MFGDIDCKIGCGLRDHACGLVIHAHWVLRVLTHAHAPTYCLVTASSGGRRLLGLRQMLQNVWWRDSEKNLHQS